MPYRLYRTNILGRRAARSGAVRVGRVWRVVERAPEYHLVGTVAEGGR